MSQRWLGLDIIRLVSFAAIAVFHITFIHYGTPDIAIAEKSSVLSAVEIFARSFAFSGFTVVFLTSLLIAFSSSSPINRLRLFGLLFFGWILLSQLVFGELGSILAWDIYPLLFLGLALCTLAELLFPPLLLSMTAIGLTMLWVPFWQFTGTLDFGAGWNMILGTRPCAVGQVEWPVLPWIGLVWLGYGVGHAIKQSALQDGIKVRKWEYLLWPSLLALSIPQLGSFYDIRLGPWFACDAYRQPPVSFWSHFGWVVFATRLSFVPSVQRWLSRWIVTRHVGELAISRKFWLAYMMHFALALGLSAWGSWSGYEGTPWEVPIVATIAILFVPLIEVTCRILTNVGSKLWSARQSSK